MYYQAAGIESHLGNLDLAVSHAEKSVQLDKSRNSWYRIILARLYEQVGRENDSIRSYQWVLDMDPSNQEAQEKVGKAK
jgi:tetratricopeptide (TPR) repeat protein